MANFAENQAQLKGGQFLYFMSQTVDFSGMAAAVVECNGGVFLSFVLFYTGLANNTCRKTSTRLPCLPKPCEGDACLWKWLTCGDLDAAVGHIVALLHEENSEPRIYSCGILQVH